MKKCRISRALNHSCEQHPLKKTKTIQSDLELAREVESEILEDVADADFSDVDNFAIKLSIEEAFANAIKHGNRYDERKTLAISWEYSGDKLIITIKDDGKGFKPSAVPDPTIAENRERPYGRGLMLINAYMDEVSHNDRGNSITMIKYKPDIDSQ